MTVCYLAAPLFTAAERAWNAELAAGIRSAFPHWDLRVPQEFCAHLQDGAGAVDFAAIFSACVSNLCAAQVVVAVLDGADADSGTAWELGHAYARGADCIGVRTDLRPAEDGASNCMLSRSCRAVCADLSSLLACLQQLRPAAP